MSDYGYPAPPPEDGRPAGDARRASGEGDYGWGQSNPPEGTSAYGAAPRPRASGRASGSASVGRASGSASVGSASVGGATGSASVTGRAGRASVGSASVGSASVGGASGTASVGASRDPGDGTMQFHLGKLPDGSPPDDDFFSRSGDSTGRASVTGRRRAAAEGELSGPGRKKKKKLGRKMLASIVAMGVIMVAAVTIVGAYFFQSVENIGDTRRSGESSTFYYADGESEAGGYGQFLHLEASQKEIPPTITEALVALEDRKFYDHSGVDYAGTMRALVNNVTGGSTQGASTITQQYAGMVLDARDEISYDRKAKEAAMAMKIEDKYDKNEIITYYLNLAYFGRGAYGIASAAEVYFATDLKDIDYAQAAYLVMQVKSPNGSYDPNSDVYDEGATTDRWNHAMKAMVEEGYITQADRDKAEQPVPEEKYESRGSWGGDTDMGFIVNEQDGYVFDELQEHYGISKKELYGGMDEETGKPISDGGYKVTLTVDKAVQDSLQTTGSRGKLKTDDEGNLETNEDGFWEYENSNDDAALKDYEESMTTAMVATNPENGNVLGYYGGDDGFGVDKAGAESPHPPSSTFKLITAATAMSKENEDGAKASIESWWNASSPRAFDSLKNEEEETCIGSGDYPDCTLRNGAQDSETQMTLTDALRNSKNTPMYSISERWGADQILQTATEMGLTEMSQTEQVEGEDGKMYDVSVGYRLNEDGTYSVVGRAVDSEGNPIVGTDQDWNPSAPLDVNENCNPTLVDTENMAMKAYEGDPSDAPTCDIGANGGTDPFYNHLAFGQYPTSVRDMSSMYATIANNGVFNESRLIAKVEDHEGNVIEPTEPYIEGEQAIDEGVARDLQWVGSEISGEDSTGEALDRDYFGKTGTWEATGKDEDGEDYPDSWNAHAWYVGAIPQLAIASWVGNVTSESAPISDPDENRENVFGSNTAYPVWYDAMTKILDEKDWDKEEWDGKEEVGTAIVDDILEADGTINPALEYCAKNADDERCGTPEEEEPEEGEDCDPANPDPENPNCEEEGDDGGLPTEDPTDGTGEDCGGLFPPPECEEETPDPGNGGDGGGGGQETTEPETP